MKNSTPAPLMLKSFNTPINGFTRTNNYQSTTLFSQGNIFLLTFSLVYHLLGKWQSHVVEIKADITYTEIMHLL